MAGTVGPAEKLSGEAFAVQFETFGLLTTANALLGAAFGILIDTILTIGKGSQHVLQLVVLVQFERIEGI